MKPCKERRGRRGGPGRRRNRILENHGSLCQTCQIGRRLSDVAVETEGDPGRRVSITIKTTSCLGGMDPMLSSASNSSPLHPLNTGQPDSDGHDADEFEHTEWECASTLSAPDLYSTIAFRPHPCAPTRNKSSARMIIMAESGGAPHELVHRVRNRYAFVDSIIGVMELRLHAGHGSESSANVVFDVGCRFRYGRGFPFSSSSSARTSAACGASG